MSHHNEEPEFKKEVLNELFNLKKSHPTSKLGKEALKVWQEYLKLMVIEGIHRAYDEAKLMDPSLDQSSTRMILDTDHIERIAHQLFIDF